MSLDYAVTATLGPACQTEDAWRRMVAAGASGFRLNTSHLTLDELLTWLDRLDPFLKKIDKQLPVVLDLQGSKWRLGEFNPLDLVSGDKIELVFAVSTNLNSELPVPHSDFFEAAPLSSPEVVMNDGKIRLSILSIGTQRITARVVLGGPISARKGITYRRSDYRQESLSPKDRDIIVKTRGYPGLQFAVSYVKDGIEAARYRQLLGKQTYMVAKLEREPSLRDADKIAQAAEELWLCRGDLGAEMGLAAMAKATYEFSARVRQFSIPVFLAGQVLEHMSEQPTPTRSEVAYIYQALKMGYKGLVLSDETATGINPEESCRIAALFR